MSNRDSQMQKFVRDINHVTKYQGIRLDEDVLESILKHIGETEAPTFLGSGSYAGVFWLKGNRKRVLKITTDPMDAYASEIIRKKPNREEFVKVYEVFEIIPRKLFGIVNEKLTPLSESEMDEWWTWEHLLWEYHSFYTELRSRGSKGLTLDFLERLEAYHEQEVERDKEEMEKAIEDGDIPDDYYWAPDPPLPTWPPEDVMEKLELWADALEERHLGVGDIKPDNMMWRGHTLVLSDLGHGSAPKQNLPKVHLERKKKKS